jgi:hypothetical protein
MVWNFLDDPAAIAAELGRNALRVAGFFCCAGSPNPIFGLPGYPGLSWLLAPFLLLGLAISLKNWRNLFQRLVALWWLIGIAPSVIAIEAPHPLRMIAALPATAILVTLGLWHSINWLAGKLPTTRNTQHALLALPILLILLPLPGLYRAYFIDWTARQDTQGAYDYGAIAIRDAVLQNAASGPIYLPLNRFNDSTLLYYLSGSFEREARLTAPPAESALVISPEKYAADSTWVRLHNGTATLLPPLTEAGQRLIQTALSGPAAQTIPLHSGDGVAAKTAPLPTDPAAQGITYPASAAFGPMQLTGANFPADIEASDLLPVTLFWQANQPMRDEYAVLVRLVDDSRRAWGNGDARPADWVYPTSWWRPGVDQIAAQHVINIDGAPPPGRYWLAVSVFDAAVGQRLPRTAGPGDSPDTVYLGPLKIPLPAPENPPPLANSPLADFGGLAQLVGFRTEAAPPGGVLPLELVWQVSQVTDVDYTVFVHLLDEAGQQVAGHDSQPVGGSYPTSIWSPGEQVIDLHGLPLPAELPPGLYRLAIGMYHQPSGERLPLTAPGGREIEHNRLVLEPSINITP